MTADPCRVVHVGGADGEWTCDTCGISFGHSRRLAEAHLLRVRA